MLMWCLFILAFLIPWAVFRRRQPTPLVIDAVLVPIAAIFGYHALEYIISREPRPAIRFLQYFNGFTAETLFLNGLIILCFVLLVLSDGRVRRFWIYLVLCLIAWTPHILLPSVHY